MKSVRPIDPVISFKNSQGESARGTLTNIQRRSLVMEVYNPYSIVQVSEVLSDLTIRAGAEHIIYQGKAFINGLVNTGLMAIVSVTLIDEWSEFHAIHQNLDRVKSEAETFVQEWETRFKVNPDYQIVVGEMRSYLAETARWVDQAELSGTLPRGLDGKLREDVFYDLGMPIMEKGKAYFYNFEEQAALVNQESAAIHRAFAQQNLHPLLMRSPFIHRTYTKPLGYAGDYEMVNQIIGEPRQGPNAYFQMINTVFLNNAVSQAHRNRIDILQRKLTELVTPEPGQKIRVLNVACGPALEVQRFLKDSPSANNYEFTLLDFSDVTLNYTKQQLDAIILERKLTTKITYVQESVHQLLKRSANRRLSSEIDGAYDFVYCAGLFDYLSDKVCTRLMEYFSEKVKSNGRVLVTNVHSENPEKNIMEHLLEWHLIYRNEKSFDAILPNNKSQVEVYKDATGINIFAEYSVPA